MFYPNFHSCMVTLCIVFIKCASRSNLITYSSIIFILVAPTWSNANNIFFNFYHRSIFVKNFNICDEFSILVKNWHATQLAMRNTSKEGEKWKDFPCKYFKHSEEKRKEHSIYRQFYNKTRRNCRHSTTVTDQNWKISENYGKSKEKNFAGFICFAKCSILIL